MDDQLLPSGSAVAALVMAEALSCAVRGATGPAVVEEIRRFADDDDDILREALRRCVAFDQLDRQSRRTAASLIQQARRKALSGHTPGE